jgi:hypothetical protein
LYARTRYSPTGVPRAPPPANLPLSAWLGHRNGDKELVTGRIDLKASIRALF